MGFPWGFPFSAFSDLPFWTEEMLNNESFPFRGLRVQDPDVVGWRAENEAVFTLTFQTGEGWLFRLMSPTKGGQSRVRMGEDILQLQYI